MLHEESNSDSSSDDTGASIADKDAVIDQGVGSGNPDPFTRIWTPYRQHYITDEIAPGKSGNPFVDLPALDDETALIVARGTYVYCVMNLYPYNPGHVMVVPYREVAALDDLTTEESAEMMSFAQAAIKVLRDVAHAEAFNVGFNMGRPAGGSVSMHLHMHIVPRRVGDANFMTVIDNIKLLPALLRDTRALLARRWSERKDTPGVAHD